MRWRAWYVGGRVLDSRDCAWDDLPDDGVLVVVQFHDDGTRRFAAGDDWYFMLDGTLAHNSDTRAENERRYPGAVLKRGMWASDDEFGRAVEVAAGAGW